MSKRRKKAQTKVHLKLSAQRKEHILRIDIISIDFIVYNALSYITYLIDRYYQILLLLQFTNRALYELSIFYYQLIRSTKLRSLSLTIFLSFYICISESNFERLDLQCNSKGYSYINLYSVIIVLLLPYFLILTTFTNTALFVLSNAIFSIIVLYSKDCIESTPSYIIIRLLVLLLYCPFNYVST